MPYSNYPASAVNNAKRALKYAEENGWGSCGTATGKFRANQIANRRPLSDATVKRVYSFLSRHEKNSNVPYGEGCGGLMYDAWGGKSMLPWARKTVKQMEQKENERARELRKKYGEEVEVRTVEVRAAEEGTRVVEGYAAVFDEVTDLGSFKEVIDREAFNGRLQDDVRLLFNHEGQPLARTTNGTLTLTTDDVGLKYRAELADTTAGRDLYELIKRGDVSQSSFAFTIAEEEREAKNVRRVKKVGQLLDVAPVVYPAYSTTNVVTSRKKDNQEEQQPKAQTETVTKMENTRNLTVNDLRAKRAQVAEELAALTAGIESENREAHEAEMEQMETYNGELRKLDGFIKMREMNAESVARMAQGGTSAVSEARELESISKAFSISRAISAVSNGRNLLGAELEMAQECQSEARACGVQMRGQVGVPSKLLYRTADDHKATSGESGAAFVPTVTGAAIEGLRAPNAMERLGVTTINATGNLEFPKVTTNAIAAAASAENAAATDSTLEIGTLSLTPQRVNNTTTYSKQLLLQGGAQVDALISRELVAGVNKQMDLIAFATLATDAADANPEINVNADTTLAFSTLTAMESAVALDGAELGGARFAVSPAIMANLRSLAAVTDISAAMDAGGNSVMGYGVIATPHATSRTFYFGNWAQACIMARFGGLDLLVDPFSAAGTAQTKIYATQYFDFGIRQGGALCASIATTA